MKRQKQTRARAEVQNDKFTGERQPSALRPMTPTQADYLSALKSSPQVVVTGPAGTGKTWLCASYAADQLRLGKVARIILTRPNVPCGRSLGFTPGTQDEKFALWCAPVLEVLKQRMGKGAFEIAVKHEQIAMVPFETIRGASWNDAFVILDEAQNCTIEEAKCFLTRIGEDCHVVLNGDIAQSDIRETSGLARVIHLIKSKGLPVPIIEFNIDDVVRSGWCAMWLRAFG